MAKTLNQVMEEVRKRLNELDDGTFREPSRTIWREGGPCVCCGLLCCSCPPAVDIEVVGDLPTTKLLAPKT